MESFDYITDKIINIKNNPLNICYRYDEINPIVKIFFSHFLSSRNFYKSKFTFFKETMSSVFLHLNDDQNNFTEMFCKIQKTYNSFRKFGYLYKYKKATISVNVDMALNEINEYDRDILCIYQHKYKYLFHIKDLIQIINRCLTNSYLFFVEPLQIKNPFNNLFFNKSTLYNIYFFIKFNTHLYPELVFKFFQVNFDLSYFLYNNEHLLREYAIKNYTTKSPSSVLYREIMIMLKKYNDRCAKKEDKIIIDADFPKNKLIKIMKPYLQVYFTITYSLVGIIKTNAQNELTYKLKKFQKGNSNFGKKIAVLKINHHNDNNNINNNINNNNKILFRQKTFITHYEWSESCIPFNEENDFLTSHLSFDNIKIYPLANNPEINNRFVYNSNQDFDYDDDDDDDDNDEHDEHDDGYHDDDDDTDDNDSSIETGNEQNIVIVTNPAFQEEVNDENENNVYNDESDSVS
jgi:hypothetical protein